MSGLYFVKKVPAGLIQERRLRQLDAEGVLKSRQYLRCDNMSRVDMPHFQDACLAIK